MASFWPLVSTVTATRLRATTSLTTTARFACWSECRWVAVPPGATTVAAAVAVAIGGACSLRFHPLHFVVIVLRLLDPWMLLPPWRQVTQPVIRNGSAFIVNVSPGFYCKALVNRTSILLGGGQHQV